MTLSGALLAAGVALVVFGMLLIMLATLRAGGEGRVEGGGVIIVGPVPIVVGSNQKVASVLLVLAVVLTVLVLITYFLSKAW